MRKRFLLWLSAPLLALAGLVAYAQVAGCGPGGNAQCFQQPVVVGNPAGAGSHGPGSLNAESIFINGTTLTGQVAGQFQGTVGGVTDQAGAGKVGEAFNSFVLVGAPVGLTTGVYANITSILLPAGDFACYGNVRFVQGAATTTTEWQGALSDQSAAMPTTSLGAQFDLPIANPATTSTPSFVTGRMRNNQNLPSTVYLVAMSKFAGGTSGGFGTINCVRVR